MPLENMSTLSRVHNRPDEQAFGIPEILEIVIDSLENTSDLACMTRVSSLSHTLSIRRLWSGDWARDGQSLRTLIHLFPPGLVVAAGGNIWRLTRPLIEDDWLRFKHYSVHMRTMYISSVNRTKVFHFPQLFESLSRFPGLFPRLQFIDLTWEFMVHNPEWMHMIGAPIRELHLTQRYGPTDWEYEGLQLFFLIISSHTPYVERLILPTIPSIEAIADESPLTNFERVLSNSFATLVRLTKISMVWLIWVPENVINAIISLPLLVDLSLGTIKLPSSTVVDSKLMPSLTSLNLHGEAISVNSILSRLKNPLLLNHVHLHSLDSNLLEITVGPILETQNISSIRLTFSKIEDPLPWSQLSPLLLCNKVTEFSLTVRTAIQGFDEDVLEEIGHSWKMLESLSLVEEGTNSDECPALIALVALGPFTHPCPNLHTIRMTVSTQVGWWSPASRSLLKQVDDGLYQATSEALEVLDVYLTRLEGSEGPEADHDLDPLSPRRLARILRTIWPDFSSGNLHDAWGSVIDEISDPVNNRERWRYTRDFLDEMEIQEEEMQKKTRAMKAIQKEKEALENECRMLRQENIELWLTNNSSDS